LTVLAMLCYCLPIDNATGSQRMNLNHPQLSRPLRKGDAVVMFLSWDDKGSICMEPYTVASAGKKQIHMLRADGSNAEFRTSASHVNYEHTAARIMFAADVTPESWQQYGRDWLAAQRAHLNERLERFGSTGAFADLMRAKLAALPAEPTLKERSLGWQS
jgi:hypothetical protein